jgi:hypothetical protein
MATSKIATNNSCNTLNLSNEKESSKFLSLDQTDPEFEKKKPEKFNCKANLKDGNLDGRFVCNF